MKLILALCFTCASFFPLCNAQVGKALAEGATAIVKFFTHDGKQVVQIIDRTTPKDRLLFNLDADLVSGIKKKHANKEWKDILLSDAEIYELSRIQQERNYLRDHPYEAAQRAELQEKLESIMTNAPLRDVTHFDWMSKNMDPNKHVVTTETYISIPSSSDEYKNIFNEDNTTAFNTTLKLYNNLRSSQNENFYFSSTADQLLQSIATESKNAITIIGHNEKGKLYFPDRSYITLRQVDEVAKEYNRIIVYLSCEAASYTMNPAVDYTLNYAEALELNRYLKWQLNVLNFGASQEEVGNKIRKILNIYKSHKSLQSDLKILVYATGSGAALYGLYKIQAPRQTEPPNSGSNSEPQKK